MAHRSSMEKGAQTGRAKQPVGEQILEFIVRSDQDVSLSHRRVRQVCCLLEFTTSQQTSIGTAVAELVGAALARAGGAKLDFSLQAGCPGALCIAIHEEEPPSPYAQRDGDGAGHYSVLRMARHLVQDVEMEVSAAGGRKFLLRCPLPGQFKPLTEDRIGQLRDHLASSVPKTLVEELRERNRELRSMQQELVLSELSLRRRIRQHALLNEVAAVLIGTESLATKLDRCAREIIEQLGIERVLIWLADGAGTMKLEASAGATDERPPPAQMVDALVGGVVAQRKLVRQSLPDEPPLSSPGKEQQIAGYPLLSDDTLLGVLAVHAREALALDVLDTLGLVASQIAMGIERLRRLEEREQLLSSEHEARVKAERATRMRDHLLAIVAHDLRNPLSAIVTSTALLKRVPVAGEELRWRKHLQTITNSVDRMNRLILDLLDVASIEAGRLRFTLSRHSLSSLMRELEEQYVPIAEGRGLRLDVQDESRAEIAADSGRLLQAMFNLLDNAFKFSPPGGTVSVRALRRGSYVVVGVTDAGPGITEADQAHVFQPYWQADPRSRSGLGLGLAIAKGVIEAHGGRVWFEPAEGGGTTFFVSLPALAESAAEEAQLQP